MIALVTGAAGFLGRYVARAAAEHGYQVIGLGHNAGREDMRTWGLSAWQEGDVTLEALQSIGGDVDVVFHCAGGASVALSMQNPIADFSRTVEASLAVLEFARTAPRPVRVVIPSSAAVYGAVEDMPIRISSPSNPASPYGVHKKMVEDLCQSYSKYYDVESSIVRLFSVYGQGLKKQLLWDASHKILAGDTVFAGTGLETRDWLHVEDAAQLLLAAAPRASRACPTVNGGSGESVAVRDIICCLAEQLGGTETPSFTGTTRSGDPLHYQADISQALAWDWKPIWHWRDGVKAYADWFRDTRK